jgi:hypothetical protein
MQGQLHESEHVRKIMADMIVACRSRMLSIPSRASLVLTNMKEPTEIAAYLRELVYEALEALSEYDPEKFNELNDKFVPQRSDDDDGETRR